MACQRANKLFENHWRIIKCAYSTTRSIEWNGWARRDQPPADNWKRGAAICAAMLLLVFFANLIAVHVCRSSPRCPHTTAAAGEW
jgi:hypothetical protein